uniref:NADPH oxidase 3 n=1 Tax=Callorhinchus milii TaxID=7868 RepID=A0A4W3H9E0_CALMI
AFLFVSTFLLYERGEAYIYTRALLGSTLAWARASAMCLNFNCLLILLPVSRNLISFFRASWSCCRSNVRRYLDKTITFHRMVGYMIVLHTVIHIIAHLFNIERYHRSYSPGAMENLQIRLSTIGQNCSEEYLNPIRTYNTNPVKELLSSIAGISGIIITMALILMVTSSTEFIIKSFYEVFWFTHHLFIIFFIGLAIHGNNEFQAVRILSVDWWIAFPRAWKWIVGPLFFYICEKLIRFCRSMQNVVITKVIVHPSRVLELQMKKHGFHSHPGQYIFLQCPAISHFQWHPFTLTSAPEEEHFSVHIRTVGDWTIALYEACGANKKVFQEAWTMPRVAVDGPFGTASKDMFYYEVSVFIAAGIGVTPFASVLKSIWYKYNDLKMTMKVKRVYFYWICRDTNAFEWFVDLLQSLEAQMIEIGKSGFLSYHIFLTGWDEFQAAHIAMHFKGNQDVITGLKQKTFYGRPNWNKEFKHFAGDHPGAIWCQSVFKSCLSLVPSAPPSVAVPSATTLQNSGTLSLNQPLPPHFQNPTEDLLFYDCAFLG